MGNIELFDSAWEFISTILVFLIGWVIALSIRLFFNCSIKRTTLLYCWHAFFSIIYALFILKFGGDSYLYYLKAGIGYEGVHTSARIFGTPAVVYIALPFVSIFKLPFIGVCLVFHIFGFIGLLAFDASLRATTRDKSQNIKLLSTIIVFLPSVSFWSSGLGKDAVSFMAVGLALWASLSLTKHIFLMVIAITLMLLVRPHIAGIMVMSLAVAFILQKSIPLIYRVFLGIISLGVVAVLVPFALNYAGVGENVDAEQLSEYIDGRQGLNSRGGSSLDISSMSLPMKLFTYMFRPLPFEAHSIASLMASLDNIALLYLFIVGSYYLIKNKLTPELKLHNRMFMWYYVIGAWGILAMTTANLGISVRQKWMIAPMLIFLLLSVIGNNKRSYV